MFKLKTSDTFTWPVVFDWPADGEFQKKELTATFRIRPTTPVDDVPFSEMFINEILVDIEIDLTDDAGNPIEATTAEKKSAAINHPIIGLALVRAYNEGIAGRQRKN